MRELSRSRRILISGTVYGQVEHKLPFHYEYLSEQRVKNISKPVRAYRIVLDEAAWAVMEAAQQHRPQSQRKDTSRRLRIMLVAVLVLVLGGIAAARYVPFSPLSPQHSALVTIETTTGAHLWSERYDRPLKDIFVLQDDIVQKIVTTLKLQLTLREQGWTVHKRTDNIEAYDYLLRGVESGWRFTQEANA